MQNSKDEGEWDWERLSQNPVFAPENLEMIEQFFDTERFNEWWDDLNWDPMEYPLGYNIKGE